MVAYVVDIQGFRDLNDKLIPKEVAVIALDHKFFGHWMSVPAHLFSKLSSTAQQQNNCKENRTNSIFKKPKDEGEARNHRHGYNSTIYIKNKQFF